MLDFLKTTKRRGTGRDAEETKDWSARKRIKDGNP